MKYKGKKAFAFLLTILLSLSFLAQGYQVNSIDLRAEETQAAAVTDKSDKGKADGAAATAAESTEATDSAETETEPDSLDASKAADEGDKTVGSEKEPAQDNAAAANASNKSTKSAEEKPGLRKLNTLAPANQGDLGDFEIGSNWVLKDFIYDGNKVIGFSDSGLEKVKTQKNLVLPHLNPADGTAVDTVGENEDSASWFHNRGLVSVSDYQGCIKYIEGHGSNSVSSSRSSGVFQNNNIKTINLPNLEKIGSYAFKNNRIEKLNLPEVKFIGPSAFQSNKITEIVEGDLPKVEVADDLAFSDNDISKAHMESLVETGQGVFFDKVKIKDAYFPKLELVGSASFQGNELTEVSPKNFPAVKYIGERAFYNNKISFIDLPEVIKIGENSFGGNSAAVKVADNFQNLESIGPKALQKLNITELNIPKLREIGSAALAGNPGVPESEYEGKFTGKVLIFTLNNDVPSKENYLVNPTLEKELTEGWTEDDFAWSKDEPTKLLGFSAQGIYKFNTRKAQNGDASVDIPDRATIIGVSAFEGMGLTAVHANNVEIVEDSAFWANRLTDINHSFPKLRETRGEYAFGANNLTNINIPTLELVSAQTFRYNKITEVTLEACREIGDFAFVHNQVKKVSLNNVLTIGEYAFAEDDLGHDGGSRVEELAAPRVKVIGKGAFMNHNLRRLDLPSVEEIGVFAFANPNTTGTIVLGGRRYPSYSDNSIDSYKKRTLESVYLPQVRKIADLAFAGNKITELDLPEVSEIGMRAFENNELKSLNLPNVKTIGPKAFRSNSLKFLNLPKVKTIASLAFGSNKLDEASLNKETETISADAFLNNRNNNSSSRETMIFLTDYENPNKLSDGIVNGVRQHVINPTKVRVRYLNQDGSPMPGSKEINEYILAPKTYEAINFYGYAVERNEQTLRAEDTHQEVFLDFHYSPREPVFNTSGIEIRQQNETDINTGKAKVRYRIGEKMTVYLYVDLTGIETSYSDAALKVYYDYRYIDDASVNVISEGAPSVKPDSTAKLGVITIPLDKISGGYQLELPIELRFNKYVTPDNYRLELNAEFVDSNGKALSKAEPIYLEAYYNKPNLTKVSPINLPGRDRNHPESNGPRYMGVLGEYVTPDDMYEYKLTNAVPVEYAFAVNNSSYLEHNVSKFVLTDTIPTYIAVKEDGTFEERKAVFDPKLNPSWSLSDDGLTATQSKSFEATNAVTSKIDPLYLSFPDLKSGTNVNNQAHLVLTPADQGPNEQEIELDSNILSIYTEKYQNKTNEGDPRFSKEVSEPRYSQSGAYFYDFPEDRAKVIPYVLRASSMAQQSDLVDVVITDYQLDERLYYYGISFPHDSHTAGHLEVRVKAYSQKGDKLDPEHDEKLFDQSIKMTAENKIVFPEDICKQIDYVQIVLPKEHKLFSAVEVSVDTKLREPDKAQYDSTSQSDKNIFKNYAVMSANLYSKGTKVEASKREEPLKDNQGVIISQYTDMWDNIPGNYLWGERAQVEIRDYNQGVGFLKTQNYSESVALQPGATGTYTLSLNPFIYSKNDSKKDRVSSLPGTLSNFELVDVLPRGLGLNGNDAVKLSEEFKALGGRYEVKENFTAGRTAIIFTTESGSLKQIIKKIAEIDTKVTSNVSDGFLTNEAYVYFEVENDLAGNPKVRKLGTTATPAWDTEQKTWLVSKRSIRVLSAKEMVARMSIRKLGDLEWSETGVATESEGKFEYRLTLANNLDQARTNVEVVDFLPYEGDVSIQEENIGNQNRPERGSEFSDKFDASRKVVVIDHNGNDVTDQFDILYWNSDAPVDYQGKSADEVIAGLNWSTEPAANTRAVRAIGKGDKGYTLPAKESLRIIIPMQAPKNDISNDFSLSGKKAWSSFVRKDEETIRFVEPNKVYNEIPAPEGTVEFTKFAQEGVNSTDAPKRLRVQALS